MSDLSIDPGLNAVLEVVVAGFALTAFFFHAIRLRAALRLRRDPIAKDVVERHLVASVPFVV